jgi:hypothetical protein
MILPSLPPAASPLIVFSFDKPYNTQHAQKMDNKPRKPFKHILSKISKQFKSKSREQSQLEERPIAGQPRDFLGVDQPDRASSAPPDIPQESTDQVHTWMSTISVLNRSAQSPILGVSAMGSLSDVLPSEQMVSTAQIGERSAASVTPAPMSTVGTTGVAMPSPSMPPPGMQTTTFTGEGLLGLLSSAAEGVLVPGVKGIFDAISNIIKITEVSHTICYSINYQSHFSRQQKPIKQHSRSLKST